MAVQPIKIPRTCSQCGHNGHSTRTCPEPTTTTNTANDGVMLFGVRLLPMNHNNSPSPNSPVSSSSSSTIFKRKCMSMNNLLQYEQQQQQQQQIPSYGSDDDSGNRNRERKRGTPWTEEEHRQFLMGLNEVGKGDWRGISRNFVKTRTPTQVASHAQKYFLRKTNLNRRRRRSSLFDITADTMSRSASISQLVDLDKPFQPREATIQQPILFSTKFSHTTTPTIASPPSSKTTHLNLNQLPKSSAISSPSSSSISTNDTLRKKDFESFLSLKLSQSPSNEESSRPGSNSFGGFNENSDSIISVA